MDLVKSHISGHLFLYPVPHLPTSSSVLLLVSWGFSSGCGVYIRPSEDAAFTAAPTAPSPKRARAAPHLYFSQTFLEPPGRPDQQALTSLCWVTSLLESGAMDTATQVTLLVLVAAAAGVSQALHIQGSPGKDDILLGSEENLSDTLLGLVRGKYFKIRSKSPP